MLQLIYELRKNWRGTGGRTDGTEIEGSIRGHGGPKNKEKEKKNQAPLLESLLQFGDPIAAEAEKEKSRAGYHHLAYLGGSTF